MSNLSGKCDRCKHDVKELQKLEFKSTEKHTEIALCKICMNAARTLWSNFMQRGGNKR